MLTRDKNQSLTTDIRYISEMVEDRWVYAARRLTSIEFSFDPCNIYRDPRGVGYTADARSVGDSHPSCLSLVHVLLLDDDDDDDDDDEVNYNYS